MNIHLLWKNLLFGACLMFVAGCSVQVSHPVSEGKDASVSYAVIQPPYPQEIDHVIDSFKQNGGVKSVQVNNDTFVVIALGQRPSAGYKVTLESVAKKSDKLIVTYAEKKPEGMAISVITYPSIVVKLTNSLLPVEVQKM